jgi:hypothetical protein
MSAAVSATVLSDDQVVELLQRYLTILQGDPSAEG